LLSLNEKQINLDYIITISSIARLMKDEELTEEVRRLLKHGARKKY
jgi:hypothetical protein